MNDLAIRFLQPSNPNHRRYEALRALLVDQLPLPEAAQRFGYSPGSLRNLLSDFRRHPERPFFLPATRSTRPPAADDPRAALRRRVLALRSQQLSANQIAAALAREGRPASVPTVAKILRAAGLPRLPRRTRAQLEQAARPLQAPAASVHELDLSPRSFRTAFGGLFLFLPALAQLRFDALAIHAGLPGSQLIPTPQAALSVLALKLWGVGRPARLMPDVLDPGPALFAGLNAIPKRSTLSEYSARIDPRHVPRFAAAWLDAARPLGLHGGTSFDLDFHTVPYHGEQAFLEKHFVSKRSRRQRGVLTFLARDAREDIFCFADANVRKADQHTAVLRFADAFRQRTGQLPTELVFDSRLTTYAVLAQLDARGIAFLTLRRRSPRLVRELLATDGWQQLTLANIGRKYRRPRALDRLIALRGYPRPIRQIAVTDLGHDKPTLLLTNQLDAKPAELVDRYARRMVIENAIAESIDFFHMDALSSAVPLKIDADLQFTVMAGTLYRLLGRRLGHGHERMRARQLFERFVRTAATVRIHEHSVEVRLGRRAHNPLLLAAGFGDDRPAIPWLGNKTLKLVIGLDEPQQSHPNL